MIEIINQIWTWITSDNAVIIGVVAFAIVIGLAFYGARKVETD